MLFKNFFLCCAVCALIAILKLPISYYNLLRVIISVGALCYLFAQKGRPFWWAKAISIFILTIFNPLFPVYLYRKAYWIPLDILTAAFFLYAYFQKAVKIMASNDSSARPVPPLYQRDRVIK